MDSTEVTAGFALAMAKLREELAPDPDNPRAVVQICPDCGGPFYRWKGQSRQACPQCSADRYNRAVDSMGARSGPTYEKAVRGALKFWVGEARRLGIELPPDP